MARTHARWKVEAWELGSDFRELSRDAQWTYVMLCSQPQINNCGVLPYAPKRWADLSADGSVRAINRALRELNDHFFVVYDERTSELVIRSFIKHDQVWKQPNLVTSARRQFREVESDAIRSVLAAKYPWLADETAQPSEGVTEPLSKGVPEGVPGSPSRRGSRTPGGRGSRGRAGAAPTPTPSPTPEPLKGEAAAEQKELTTEARPADLNGSDPAAAAELAEPPRDSEIRKALDELGIDGRADRQVLTAIAERTLAGGFQQRVKQAGRYGVKNRGGYLRTTLSIDAEELAAVALAAIPTVAHETTPSRIERWKRDEPRDYVQQLAPALERKDLEQYLDGYVPIEDTQMALRDLWADIRRPLGLAV